MFSRKFGFVAMGVAALALAAYVVSVNAGQPAAGQGGKTAAGQNVTIAGRVVDLHCFITGNYASADHAKCTADCIRQGVTAALETDHGLVILGQGMNSPAKAVMPFAFQEVEATGKLYTKDNVKYLDLSSIRAYEEQGDEEGDHGVDEDSEE